MNRRTNRTRRCGTAIHSEVRGGMVPNVPPPFHSAFPFISKARRVAVFADGLLAGKVRRPVRGVRCVGVDRRLLSAAEPGGPGAVVGRSEATAGTAGLRERSEELGGSGAFYGRRAGVASGGTGGLWNAMRRRLHTPIGSVGRKPKKPTKKGVWPSWSRKAD